jgi:hypothetical protein
VPHRADRVPASGRSYLRPGQGGRDAIAPSTIGMLQHHPEKWTPASVEIVFNQ